MIKEAPLRYTVTFYVEADNREALRAAMEYVAAYIADGVTGYVCGSYLCICRPKVEWNSDSQLIVMSCVKRTARVVAKSLVKAYTRYGGKAMQIVRCEMYKP